MKKITVVFLILFAVSGCVKLEKEDMNQVQILQNKVTHHFGRHSIDIPAEFVLSDEVTAVFEPVRASEADARLVLNVTVLKSNATLVEFKRKILNRESEIKASARARTGILKEVRRLSETVVIFRIQKINQAYISELHQYLDGHYVRVSADSYNNQFETVEAEIVNFLKNLKNNKSDPGRGSDYRLGELGVSGRYSQESSQFLFRSVEHPDVVFTLRSNTYVPDSEETLLERVDGPRSLLKIFDANNKVIRSREFQIASMKAQEWLSWIILGGGDKSQKQYGFALETMRLHPSPLLPQIHLELDTGQPDATGAARPLTLGEPQIINLWDATVSSIRHSAQ